MGLYPRERLPNAAAAYLEAYIALETSAHKAQTLVDRLLSITLALTGESISRSRNSGWKVAAIQELPTLEGAASYAGHLVRVAKIPKAEQLLEAIGDWRKKRNYLQQLWDRLPGEVRTILKLPETLD
jgi:hypothetical protein